MEVERILIAPDRLQDRVRELGQAITSESEGMDLVLVGVLRGAFIFLADLLRALEMPASIDFLAASSYGSGTESTGEVRIAQDLKSSVQGRDVILVEDIIDTGFTLRALKQHVGAHQPLTLRTCSLLSKPSRRLVAIEADWTGFEIPDEFVVGYGLDYAEQYRGLPYIGTLHPSQLQDR